MRIFLTHTRTAFDAWYGPEALAGLERLGTVVRNPTAEVLDPDALARHAAGCAIVVADRQVEAPARLFSALPDLVAFVRCAVDIRTVDVFGASAQGILVTRASPGFVASVSEWIFGALIAFARGIPEAVAAYRAGTPPAPRMGRQLAGATLGVIGYGAIGRATARLAGAFGMRVLVADPGVTVVEPGLALVPHETLLAEADIVVLLAVATPETENMIDAAALARMKVGAILVNAGRGNLVDEAALAAALDSGRLAGAVLDVGRAADQMPSPALARRPDVLATPHVGGLTPEAVSHQAMETVRQVERIAAGEAPPGAVNADAAARLVRLRRA